MARTVTSELERRRRGESGGEQKGDKGVEEEGVVEKNFMWEGGDGGENFVGLEEDTCSSLRQAQNTSRKL